MDWAELDLFPPYPTPASLKPQLESKVLSIDQRRALINHSLRRACLFADLALLSFVLQKIDLIDLNEKDEDGLCIVSRSILGFGDQEADRAVDREECIRLLINHGARVNDPDYLGWTPLHHAALRAPPTLIVYLISHGASPLAMSHKSLTPLDIISAYQPMPGRTDVALLLEDSMRAMGWTGSPLERRRNERRRRREAAIARTAKSAAEWSRIGRNLGIEHAWWGETSADGAGYEEDDFMTEPGSKEDMPDEFASEEDFSPPPNFASMLVFSPSAIPELLQWIIVQAVPAAYPVSRRSQPANTIYYLARFACLHCDDSWLDALIAASLDCIEVTTYQRPDKREDMAHTVFWLYNASLLLHLLKCDQYLVEACDRLDLFFLLEELIKSLYAFVLRGAERRIQNMIEPALLDYSSLTSEFDSLQFESDWSFFRTLTTPKRKQQHLPSGSSSSLLSLFESPATSRPATNGNSTPLPPPSPAPGSKNISSLRQTVGHPNHFPLNGAIPPSPSHLPDVSPASITAILSSLHSLLTLYCINPAIIIQAHSQVMYWTACETFNRMIIQKKYLCRSRAMQIGLNISVLDEWVTSVGLPGTVSSHWQTFRELLIWLQCHSAIDQFTSLIDTIQTMKVLNPIQMRRAVRDYRYEVSEGHMDEECAQYLVQLQKDWERRRVQIGVEALQKDVADRNREREGSITSEMSGDLPLPGRSSPSVLSKDGSIDDWHVSEKALTEAQVSIDLLFDRSHRKNEWVSPIAPTALGELMDSSFALPLVIPSDPVLIAAWPGPGVEYQLQQEDQERMRQKDEHHMDLLTSDPPRSASRASVGNRGAMEWRLRGQTVRVVTPDILDHLDGDGSSWRVRLHQSYTYSPTVEGEGPHNEDNDDMDGQEAIEGLHIHNSMEPPSIFTKRPRRLSKIPRESSGADTIVPS